MLVLTSKTNQRSDKTHYFWIAVCDKCGKQWRIRKGDLQKVKCCDAWGGGGKPRTNWRDYSGQTVGYLKISKPAGVNDRGLLVWEAICIYEGCGKRVEVASDVLRGRTVSCGCYARKQTRMRALAKYKGDGS